MLLKRIEPEKPKPLPPFGKRVKPVETYGRRVEDRPGFRERRYRIASALEWTMLAASIGLVGYVVAIGKAHGQGWGNVQRGGGYYERGGFYPAPQYPAAAHINQLPAVAPEGWNRAVDPRAQAAWEAECKPERYADADGVTRYRYAEGVRNCDMRRP